MILQKIIIPSFLIIAILAIFIFILQHFGKKTLNETQESEDSRKTEPSDQQNCMPKRSSNMDLRKIFPAFSAIFISFVGIAFAFVWLGRSNISKEFAQINEKTRLILQTKQIFGIAHIIDVFGSEVFPKLVLGPDIESIESNYIVDEFTFNAYINKNDANCTITYALRQAPMQESKEITFSIGQKAILEDITKNRIQVSYKTSIEDWKPIPNEDLHFIRVPDKTDLVIRVPFPDDAHEEDGLFNFKLDYFIYGWKTCDDYEAYMELRETDCGPPSIYSFDTRKYPHSIKAVNIKLHFSNVLPYIRVKNFNEQKMKLDDVFEYSRAIMDSLDDKGEKGADYSLTINNPQSPFVIFFEQDSLDIEAISNDDLAKLKALPYIK